MEILNRLIGELKEALQYFKQRTKHKYYGDRFEEWVVMHSNISKDGNGMSGTGGTPPFWRLLEWRGDKYVNGYYPVSSSAPDLLLECISNESKKYLPEELIAVECKWRSTVNFFIPKSDAEKYEKYFRANKTRYRVKHLFYLFGFGWSDNAPEAVYIIPSAALYEYDENTFEITFPNGESIKDKKIRMEDYKMKCKILIYTAPKNRKHLSYQTNSFDTKEKGEPTQR